MIERTLLARDETSRFFHHNKKIAETWKSLTKDLDGNINGQVNGQIFEFKLEFVYDSMKVEVDGIRQMSNINAGINTGFAMTKNTVISISNIDTTKFYWKIYQRNRFLDFYYKLARKFQILNYDSKYAFITSESVKLNQVISKDKYKNISAYSELRSIENKNSIFRIEYFNLLGADSLLELIKTLLKR